MRAEEFFIGKKLALDEQVRLWLQGAEHHASIGWRDHRPGGLWHGTALPVADLPFEDGPGWFPGNVGIHTLMQIDPTRLQKSYDAKLLSRKGQVKAQQGQELRGETMTRHHAKEPRSVFSERFGIEELDEPIAAENFSA
jgi:hypothetical protein